MLRRVGEGGWRMCELLGERAAQTRTHVDCLSSVSSSTSSSASTSTSSTSPASPALGE